MISEQRIPSLTGLLSVWNHKRLTKRATQSEIQVMSAEVALLQVPNSVSGPIDENALEQRPATIPSIGRPQATRFLIPRSSSCSRPVAGRRLTSVACGLIASCFTF